MSRFSPPLDVRHWASIYDAWEGDDETYREVLNATPDPLERARRLWAWKGLSLGTDFTPIKDTLSSPALRELVAEHPTPAETIQEDAVGAIDSLKRTLSAVFSSDPAPAVTPAFLLHLTATSTENGAVRYASAYPIYDKRVWAAYCVLNGRPGRSDNIPTYADSNSRRYHEFCTFFERCCPADIDPREFEKALFALGKYVQDQELKTLQSARDHLRGTAPHVRIDVKQGHN